MAAVGAVVLAGGRSSRMGRDKAGLQWRGTTLLQRTVDVVGAAVAGPVLVVRAAGQSLPSLPAEVTVVDDSRPAAGPLQGLADGLAAVDAPAAFVCATDLPFLHPAFVRRVVAALGDADVALPVVGGFRQPLVAAYRIALAARAADLLAAGESRPGALLAGCDVVLLDERSLLADPELRRHDPDLLSVVGVNDQAAYESALARGSS